MAGEKRETEEVREQPLTTLFLSLLFFSDEGCQPVNKVG